MILPVWASVTTRAVATVTLMGASASLSSSSIRVEPGEDAVIDLRVRNTGDVVDRVVLSAVGDAAGWISVEPPTITLLPDDEKNVSVRFHPPRSSSTPAGITPFAVKAFSQEDPDNSSVDEGTVEVAPFDDRAIELMPRTTRGRRTGKQRIAFDNRGNDRVNVRFSGIDPNDQVEFSFTPPGIIAEPGKAEFAKVAISPRKKFWKGPPVTHQYQVIVEEEGKDPLVEMGTMVQQPLLSQWFWKAVIAAIAIVAALAIVWQTLLRPTVETAARDAVEEPVQEAVQAAETAKAAAQDAGAAASGSSAQGADAGAQPAEPPASTSISPYGDAIDFRLTRSKPSYVVANGSLFSMADVVLQNPSGDSGSIAILRNDDVLMESALDDFRFLDSHFVSPYLFKGGDSVKIRIDCKAPGSGQSNCTAGASFSGFTRKG